MPVPTWLRSVSKTKFLWRLYRLNMRLGEIVDQYPKKYRPSYGDMLINNALKALAYAQMGNDIYMRANMPESEYTIRRRHLKEAKSYTELIATMAFIFLERASKADGVKLDKLRNQQEEMPS